MKIAQVIHSGNMHPAVGPELKIKLVESNETYNIWSEWFFDLIPNWKGDINDLVGLEVTQEFIDNYKN